MTGLRTEGLCVTLGRRMVLNGVDLALGQGRLVGLIGPNGAGKTTLLRALAGLVPAAGGRILLDEEPLARTSRRLRRTSRKPRSSSSTRPPTHRAP